MARYGDIDALSRTIKLAWDTSDSEDFEKSVFIALETAPTADVVEREDLDEITEAHERIGYDRGFRDGYAQAVEDARKFVGSNTWAGSRISRLQPPAQPERKRGKWEMEWNSFFGLNVPRCSVCHKLAAVRTPICPNCFAQMDTFDLKEEK